LKSFFSYTFSKWYFYDLSHLLSSESGTGNDDEVLIDQLTGNKAVYIDWVLVSLSCVVGKTVLDEGQ